MNSRTKIAVTMIIGVVVLGFGLMFGFKPLLSNVRELNLALSERQTELDEINKQILEFKTAQTDLARATFKDDVSETIVIKEDLALAITQLETAAAATGTDESIQITETAEGQTAARTEIFSGLAQSEEVQYTMSVKNDFEGIVEFLQYLEHMPHFTEFSGFTLNSVLDQVPASQGGGTVNTGTVQGTIEGSFLVQTTNGSAEEVPAQ